MNISSTRVAPLPAPGSVQGTAGRVRQVEKVAPVGSPDHAVGDQRRKPVNPLPRGRQVAQAFAEAPVSAAQDGHLQGRKAVSAYGSVSSYGERQSVSDLLGVSLYA